MNPFCGSKARTVVGREGGQEPAMICDPGSELRQGGRKKRTAKTVNEMEKSDNKWNGKKKKKV